MSVIVRPVVPLCEIGAQPEKSSAPLRVVSMHEERHRSERCDRPHVGTTAPRRLCTAGHVSCPDHGCRHLIDVHVSLCPSRREEFVAPALITMAGELSAITVEVVRSAVLDFVRFARHAVIDLTGLEKIDDRGVRLLDELGDVVGDLGGTIAIHNPGVVVEHVIRFCGVGDHIVICAPR